MHSMQNYVLCLKDLCGKTEMNVCVFFLIGNQTEVVRTGNEKRRCVKMHTFCFLRTKPRLSQAGALLLPKDFVSLGIRISL